VWAQLVVTDFDDTLMAWSEFFSSTNVNTLTHDRTPFVIN
jgi:hypothetical protein